MIAFSQGDNSNPFIDQIDIFGNPTLSDHNLNSAVIYQIGFQNSASIAQTFSQEQILFIEKPESGSSSYVLQQGTGNFVDLSIEGNSNSTNFFQFGNFNSITQDIYGENLSFIFIQNGNRNSIEQVDYGVGPGKYTVIQNGNGMNVKVVQSNIFRN